MVPVVVLGAWSTGAAEAITRPAVRRLAMLLPLVLLAFMVCAAWVFADVAHTLDDSGLAGPPRRVAEPVRGGT